MNISNWCNWAGIKLLGMKSKRYNRVRKRGHEIATKVCLDANGLSEDELDEWYEEYTRSFKLECRIDNLYQKYKGYRRTATEMLRMFTMSFLSHFRAFAAILALYGLFALLSAIGLFDGWRVAAALAILAFFCSFAVLDAEGNDMAAAYEFYGFTEGLVAFADYCGYEEIDLSKLPKLETIIGEALY